MPKKSEEADRGAVTVDTTGHGGGGDDGGAEEEKNSGCVAAEAIDAARKLVASRDAAKTAQYSSIEPIMTPDLDGRRTRVRVKVAASPVSCALVGQGDDEPDWLREAELWLRAPRKPGSAARRKKARVEGKNEVSAFGSFQGAACVAHSPRPCGTSAAGRRGCHRA